jgi:UTP:GlnB (protein PII) uridylyltransferase
MDIHRGQVMTTPEGLVLAVFEFSDAEGYLAGNRGAPRQIHRMLEAVVAGSVDMADLLREHTRSHPQRRSASTTALIHLDNAQSDDATVLEIVASDAPGFLYRIARVIALAGCTVDLALVSTEYGKAVDVLHITREKRRLSEPEQHSLHMALERVLAGEEGWQADV